MSAPEIIRTLASPSRLEIDKIKGSRFLASLSPIASRDEARAFLESMRHEFRDATHNCFAWRLDMAESFRYSDDGEPSGTAGRPILQEIDGRGLIGVIAVVTRYYGGTKLGTGGLVRAYSGAAGAALDEAQIVERPVMRKLKLLYEYGLSGAIEGVLHSFSAQTVAAEYGESVCLEISIEVGEATRLIRTLEEATAGRAQVEES